MENGQSVNENEQYNTDYFANFLRENGERGSGYWVNSTMFSLNALLNAQKRLQDAKSKIQKDENLILSLENDLINSENQFRKNFMATILYISNNPPKQENIFKRFWNWCKGVVNKAKSAWQNYQAKKPVSEKIDVEFENLQETINSNYKMCEGALNSANNNEEVMSAIKDLDERNNNAIKKFQEKSNEIINDATNISDKAKYDLNQNVNKKVFKTFQKTRGSASPLKKVKDAAEKFKPKAKEETK